jgi:pimeloyl-ACP methyl ester carboxylesterase
VPGHANGAATRAATIVWEARPVAELYRVGEVRAFEFRQNESAIGRSWGRYEGTVDDQGVTLHRFATRIELELPDRPPVRSEGEIFVDGDGELVRGFERSDAAELRFDVAGGLLRLASGKESETLSFPPGTAYMAYMATLHEELMLALRTLRTGPMELRLVSLSGALPTEWSATVVDRGGGTLELETSLGEQIELREGRIRRVTVAGDGLAVEALPQATWPEWTIQGPRALAYAPAPDAGFDRRDVELPGRPGEPRLVGEVLVPRGKKGRLPAALFVAGSGLSDRYGFSGPPPVDLGFHEITDALANAGLVVLRFDERGQGGSEAGELSWEGQLEDARRALRMLMVQDEVDPARIVLVGHAEGGWKALRLALERKGTCAGIALLAAPGRPYREILRDSAEQTIARLDPRSRKEAYEQHDELVRRLEQGTDVPEEFRTQAAWLRGVLAEDPHKLVAKVDCPLWIAHGDKDFEVSSTTEPPALARAAQRGKQRAEVRRYPDLDHLFKREPGVSRPRNYLEDRPVDPGFLGDLTAWARRRTAR